LEPCAYTNKFPNARLHYWYGRGFNMAESYWMSVRNPYEGVFIGDPLCQPYARASQVAVAGLASNAVVSNTVNLTVTVVAAGSNRPVNEVRLYLDEFYLATLTNITPRAGNDVKDRLNGNARTYTAPAGATLLTVATGLAARINAAPSLGVTARAVADRVEIVQDALGVAGTGLTCSAISSNNSSGELTVFPFVPFTNFLETTAAAYEQVTLSGAPAVGDIVRAVVTRLDGVKITNQVMAQAGDDAYTLLTNLAGVVNANTNLQSTSGCEVKWTTYNLFIAGGYDTYFVSRTNTWQGYNLYLNFSLSLQPGSTLSGGVADNFNFNADVLGARATIFLAAGRTNFACGYTLVTTNLADGPHTLRAVACEGTAVKAQGQTVIPFQVDNHGDQCVITNPAVGATFLLSESIPVQVWAAPAGGAITAVQFHAEAKRAAATNAAPYTCTLAASQYGVGELQLFARAFNSNGRVVDSLPVGVTILPDYDFDGLEDQWEIRNFGSIAVYNGTNDPDSDTFNNWLEYTADTEPTNAASYFRITAVGGPWTGALPRLTFVSSTAREYRIHCNDIALTSALYWLAASNVFMGAAGLTTWVDDGSDLPPLGGDRRYYRVRVRRP